MNIELLTYDPAKLEAMSDAELKAYWEPYLKVTRPELQEHKPDFKAVKSSSNNHNLNKEKREKLEKARQLAEQLGLKIKI